MLQIKYSQISFSDLNPCSSWRLKHQISTRAIVEGFYNLLTNVYPPKLPAVLIKDGKPVNYLPDEGRYDLRIIHPRSIYFRGRPTWNSLNNQRKPINIKIRSKIKVFLIQAYYSNEWLKNSEFSVIPADQTYIKNINNSYNLFLQKGKYKIVVRDMDYEIVNITNRKVR